MGIETDGERVGGDVEEEDEEEVGREATDCREAVDLARTMPG